MSEHKKSRSIVTHGEKISDTQYKLITEDGYEYAYNVLDVLSDTFIKEDKIWRLRVMEGEAILLRWIQKPEGESPAYICWNYERRAMLEVKLKTDFREKPEFSNYYGSEINPFGMEILDEDGWEKDPNCPLSKQKFA